MHATSRETPAKLFFNHTLQTRLDLLKRSVEKQVRDLQMKQAFSSKKGREFQIGQSVIARNYRTKKN